MQALIAKIGRFFGKVHKRVQVPHGSGCLSLLAAKAASILQTVALVYVDDGLGEPPLPPKVSSGVSGFLEQCSARGRDDVPVSYRVLVTEHMNTVSKRNQKYAAATYFYGIACYNFRGAKDMWSTEQKAEERLKNAAWRKKALHHHANCQERWASVRKEIRNVELNEIDSRRKIEIDKKMAGFYDDITAHHTAGGAGGGMWRGGGNGVNEKLL